MYRRILNGVVSQGRTKPFLEAMRANAQHQEDRGIRARISVWSAMTGQTNSVMITSDFNTLEELERFTELAAEDASFANIRSAVRKEMEYASEVAIDRLSYQSEGLITSEDATAPHRYIRVLKGQVQAGRHREFVLAISQAFEYQRERGVQAHTSVWSAMTGVTSGVSIVGEFDSLAELEKFDELAVTDAEFGRLRAASRSAMVFLTSNVQLLRNLM